MTDKRVPRELLAEIELARQEGWNAGVEYGWKQGRANALEEITTERAANATAAPDEREPPGEPDAWLVTDPINPSQVFSERPEPSEIPGGCLVALYSEERLAALRAERDALRAALRELVDARQAFLDTKLGSDEETLADGRCAAAMEAARALLAAPEDAPK